MNRYALHIGLNQVNPGHYGSSFPVLKGAVNDAMAMQRLLQPLGYAQQIPLQGSNATATNVQQELTRLAGTLVAGDLLVITYSGHGSQIIDVNGDDTDGLDEVFILWDRLYLDDELRRMFGKFRLGVRIVVISDSCNSGTNIELAVVEESDKRQEDNLPTLIEASLDQPDDDGLPAEEDVGQSRLISSDVAMAIVSNHPDLYGPIMKQAPLPASGLRATILSLPACRDEQQAWELPTGQHGWFTYWLTHELTNNGLPNNYLTLCNRMIALTAQYKQTPQLKIDGPNSPALQNQKPFL